MIYSKCRKEINVLFSNSFLQFSHSHREYFHHVAPRYSSVCISFAVKILNKNALNVRYQTKVCKCQPFTLQYTNPIILQSSCVDPYYYVFVVYFFVDWKFNACRQKEYIYAKDLSWLVITTN